MRLRIMLVPRLRNRVVLVLFFLISQIQTLNCYAYDFTMDSGVAVTAGGGAGYDVAKNSLPEKIGNYIAIALSLMGVIFLCLAIYGGFLWMTARGEESKAEEAQKIIRNGVIGIIVILAAYSVTMFVSNLMLK